MPMTGQGACGNVDHAALLPRAKPSILTKLVIFDRRHERIAFAAGFSSGADFDRVADRDLRFDRPVHRDLAGQVFLEALDRLDDARLGAPVGDVVRWIVIELLREVGVFEQSPAPRLLRLRRGRP